MPESGWRKNGWGGEGQRMLRADIVTRTPILISWHFFSAGYSTLLQHSFTYSFVCLALPFLGKATRLGQDEGERIGLG